MKGFEISFSKKLEPIYEKLGKDFAEVKSVTIAKMDATTSDPPPTIEIQGFPTLFLFPANDKVDIVLWPVSNDLFPRSANPHPFRWIRPDRQGEASVLVVFVLIMLRRQALKKFIKAHASIPYTLPKKNKKEE